MMNKNIVIGVVVIIILALGFVYFSGNSSHTENMEEVMMDDTNMEETMMEDEDTMMTEGDTMMEEEKSTQ